MRDDFGSQIKDILSKRVGLRCSNPNCRVLTAGPNSFEDKATNIGVAAHITAASFKGPRYDTSMTPIERSSIRNGIWLCQSCAKLVDNDPSRYTVQLLLKWKTEAENETDLELTKKIKPKISTEYDKIFKLMPALVNEFKEDIEKTPLLREFILQGKGWRYNNSSGRKLLVYFFEDHEDLEAKIRLLENNNLINDITYNNTKRFVFTEELVEILNSIDKYPSN
jgi:hypothetical protein